MPRTLKNNIRLLKCFDGQEAFDQVLIGLSEFVVDRINWDLYPGLIALLGEVHTIMSKFDQIFT